MNTIHFPLYRERHALALLGLICLALMAGALYRQIVWGEAPCPLCIMQRYALLLIAVFAFTGAGLSRVHAVSFCEGGVILGGWIGVVAAGRQVYVAAFPAASCGFDTLQPWVDQLPLASVFPSVFRVAGFCSTLYPPVLGLSLAQWALLAFVLIVVLVPFGVYRNRRRCIAPA